MSGGLSASDLDAAVAQGLIDAKLAAKLGVFARARATAAAAPDEESFRLLTGFNDIFVTIGLALFLGALGWLISQANMWLAQGVISVAAWLLAEVFTRKRHMALPSIALLATFVASLYWLVAVAGASIFTDGGKSPAAFIAAGLVAAAGAALHWRRFHVPITVAAGVAALAATFIAVLSIPFPEILSDHPVAVFLPIGLIAFALAMHFDISDRERHTRRTDIAFWLHLVAAPAIVHPVVWNMVHVSNMVRTDALIILVIFLILALVALIADRRALLVSSLSYLIYAGGTLIASTAWESSAYAMAVLAVGAVVLLLSIAWRPLRAGLLSLMPAAIMRAVPPAS